MQGLLPEAQACCRARQIEILKPKTNKRGIKAPLKSFLWSRCVVHREQHERRQGDQCGAASDYEDDSSGEPHVEAEQDYQSDDYAYAADDE